jgi:hypothetical protein
MVNHLKYNSYRKRDELIKFYIDNPKEIYSLHNKHIENVEILKILKNENTKFIHQNLRLEDTENKLIDSYKEALINIDEMKKIISNLKDGNLKLEKKNKDLINKFEIIVRENKSLGQEIFRINSINDELKLSESNLKFKMEKFLDPDNDSKELNDLRGKLNNLYHRFYQFNDEIEQSKIVVHSSFRFFKNK